MKHLTAYDLIIRSESGQMWRCHKLVVCTQSEVMQRTIETGAMLQSVSFSFVNTKTTYPILLTHTSPIQIAEKNEILLDDDATVINRQRFCR